MNFLAKTKTIVEEVTFTFTREEAELLCKLVGSVGGDYHHRLREKLCTPIYGQLTHAGISAPHDIVVRASVE